MKTKNQIGWTKERQEKFPEGWAKTLAAFKFARVGKGHIVTDYQRQHAHDINLGNTHRLGKPKSKAECEKISKSSTGKRGTRNGVKESEITRQKKSVSIREAFAHMDPIKKALWQERRKLARSKQVLPLKDTSIEVALQNELTSRGIKFEKHKPICGLPDIFIEPNICIFADGDYWHANPKGKYSKVIINFNKKARTAEEIREKDRKITETLIELGYKVFRFWESDIKKNVSICVDQIGLAV